jgi:hypothetical protein
MQSVHPSWHPVVSAFLIWIGVIGVNLAIWRWVGGLPQLVKHYAQRSPFVGQKWHWQSMAIDLLSYRSCVTVGANAMGLYIAPWWIFRAGCPPIVIPWSELQVDGPQWWWLMRMYVVRTQACPKVVIRLPRRLFQQVAIASDGRLSGSFD